MPDTKTETAAADETLGEGLDVEAIILQNAQDLTDTLLQQADVDAEPTEPATSEPTPPPNVHPASPSTGLSEDVVSRMFSMYADIQDARNDAQEKAEKAGDRADSLNSYARSLGRQMETMEQIGRVHGVILNQSQRLILNHEKRKKKKKEEVDQLEIPGIAIEDAHDATGPAEAPVGGPEETPDGGPAESPAASPAESPAAAPGESKPESKPEPKPKPKRPRKKKDATDAIEPRSFLSEGAFTSPPSTPPGTSPEAPTQPQVPSPAIVPDIPTRTASAPRTRPRKTEGVLI